MTFSIEQSDDLETCLRLRYEVFVVEQGVSLADEQDGLDDRAIHFLVHMDKTPVGTARILVKDDVGKIGRVCVTQSARGTGLGAALINACVEYLRKVPEISQAQLGAQTQALGFYEKLGFEAFGPVYNDAGLPHRDMKLRF